jgi:hypothetical protein
LSSSKLERAINVIAALFAIGTGIYSGYDVITGPFTKRPQLAYAVKPVPALIADPAVSSRIAVLVNGQTTSNRIFVTQVEIFNEGSYAIEPKDFTGDKIRIVSSPPTAFIDVTLQSVTNDLAVGFGVDRTHLAAGEVPVTWALLEGHDGVVVQLVYSVNGKRLPTLTVVGRIKGQDHGGRPHRVETDPMITLQNMKQHIGLLILVFLVDAYFGFRSVYSLMNAKPKLNVFYTILFFVVTASCVWLGWSIARPPNLPLRF